MKNYTKVITATLISASLMACGGGSGSSSEPVAATPPPAPAPVELTKISGMAIDGYIVGATAFMDLNFNGVHDDGEPSTVTVEPTEDNPSWVIEIPEVHEDCGQYVPFVIHVPVGAIDLDTPDTPIAEAYDLVTPPSFVLQTDEDLLNATPLTTVIWNAVEQQLRADDTELSCESIIANQKLRENIEVRLLAQEIRVAQRYNITVDSLYSDYVAKGNSELHGLARALVPGLSKSYTETLELEEARPDATIVFVEYFFDMEQGGGLSSKAWFRREFIQTSPGNFDDISHAMSGGLQRIGAVISARTLTTSTSNGIEARVETNYEDAICGITEKLIEYAGKVGYSLTNVASLNDSTWAECPSMDRITNNIAQRFNTDTYPDDAGDTDGSRDSYSEHTYNSGNSELRVELIGATTDDFSGGWLVTNMSHISLDFYDDGAYGSDFWMRGRTEFPESGDIAQYIYTHSSDDTYTVSTYFTDGTNSKQCGTWSGGESSLVDCT